MIKIKNGLLCILSGMALIMNVHAAENKNVFMTAHDVQSQKVSNISITNRTAAPITISGLFIASYDVNDCSACYGSIMGGDNLSGVVVSPVTFKVNQSIPIGQNYLYNMIYNGIYFINANNPGSTPCSLPGCSWPGDSPNVTGWCLTINAASPNSSYTYSYYTNGSSPAANIPAYGSSGNSQAYNYKYNLIDPLTLGSGNACLGPIVCNDQTLTCQVGTTQSESLQAYS